MKIWAMGMMILIGAVFCFGGLAQACNCSCPCKCIWKLKAYYYENGDRTLRSKTSYSPEFQWEGVHVDGDAYGCNIFCGNCDGCRPDPGETSNARDLCHARFETSVLDKGGFPDTIDNGNYELAKDKIYIHDYNARCGN